tara:strand:+ start:5555 stop:6526 length:972 start_codon:yes stop_codon:yes gene_type:complete
MKLIMESWRGFVKEAAISEAKRLAIFDFDGTIGFTGAKVAVLNKNTGKTARLSDKEFLAFLETLPEDERKNIEQKPNESENYKVDYSEYSTVSNDTVENRPVLEKMAEFARDNEASLFVLTARAPGEEGPDGDPMSAVDDIQTYLKTFGIEPDHIMALAGKPKAEFIDGLLNQNKSVEELVVYEDSMSNLKSIDSMMTRKYSGFTHTVMHYKKIEQKVIDYSLFYVDGNSVTPLETKTNRTRGYKAEKDAAHKAMSKYLADKHNMRLIPRGKLEGIISVMSGRLAVPDLLKSVKEAEKVMSIDTTSWAKHYDTFSNILFDMIR